MKQTICDICGQVIPEGSHWKRRDINNVVFEIVKDQDICYYCACDMVWDAACKWRKESDQSVEGKKREKRKLYSTGEV